MFFSQLRQEFAIMARNGEQLLLLIGIPVMLLVFFTQVDILPTQGLPAVEFLVPGILGLAVMSSAMVSLGIATGFERSYGVLKRLGTTPLGKWRLVIAKIAATCVIEALQLGLLVVVGLVLGWRPVNANWLAVFVAVALGTTSFAGLGLTLAGRLRAEINLAAQNGLYLVMFLLGGIVVPTEELPSFSRVVSLALPSTALSNLLRDSFSGQEFTSNSLLVLVIWAIASCAAAVLFFRWSD